MATRWRPSAAASDRVRREKEADVADDWDDSDGDEEVADGGEAMNERQEDPRATAVSEDRAHDREVPGPSHHHYVNSNKASDHLPFGPYNNRSLPTSVLPPSTSGQGSSPLILKRGEKLSRGSGNDGSAGSASASASSAGGSGTPPSQQQAQGRKTLAQREKEYEEARRRIFGGGGGAAKGSEEGRSRGSTSSSGGGGDGGEMGLGRVKSPAVSQ